jgi:hypothetical protein
MLTVQAAVSSNQSTLHGAVLYFFVSLSGNWRFIQRRYFSDFVVSHIKLPY